MAGATRQGAAAAAVRPLIPLFVALFVAQAAAACGDARDSCVTELHQHAAFFDRNGDGVISPSETYDAFRALGFGIGVSGASAAFINGALGSKCRPANATSSKLNIYVEEIQKGKHGSDTGAYDTQGRFVPEKFEAIFAKHAKTCPDALTSDEIDELLQANREPGDYSGWAGAEAEWKILYSLGKDENGLLRKDVVRSVYDGSLFHKLLPNWSSSAKPSAVN